MSRRRAFVGLTTLVVVIIILFMLVFSSLAYLNSDNYSSRAERRISVREEQYDIEYEMYETVYEIMEEYNSDNLKEIVSSYSLEYKGKYYSGMIEKGDYLIVYYLEISDKVSLESYHLENTSEQNYGEQKFDF